jgi:hypothetical protein
MAPPLTFTVGKTGINLRDEIIVDGVAYSLTGATLSFSMRYEASQTLKISAAAATSPSPSTGVIEYAWQAADVDEQGRFWGWWTIDPISGAEFDTPEFLIVFDFHTQGQGVQTGAVAQKVKEHIPIVWDALSKDARYGDTSLQGRIDVTKFRLFGTSVSAATEATMYNPLVLDYVGKLSSLSILVAAADYWSAQTTQETITGTDESRSFPDRLKHVWDLYKQIKTQADDMASEVAEFGVIPPFKKGSYPKTRSEPWLSPNPDTWGDDDNVPTNLPAGPFR